LLLVLLRLISGPCSRGSPRRAGSRGAARRGVLGARRGRSPV